MNSLDREIHAIEERATESFALIEALSDLDKDASRILAKEIVFDDMFRALSDAPSWEISQKHAHPVWTGIEALSSTEVKSVANKAAAMAMDIHRVVADSDPTHLAGVPPEKLEELFSYWFMHDYSGDEMEWILERAVKKFGLDTHSSPEYAPPAPYLQDGSFNTEYAFFYEDTPDNLREFAKDYINDSGRDTDFQHAYKEEVIRLGVTRAAEESGRSISEILDLNVPGNPLAFPDEEKSDIDVLDFSEEFKGDSLEGLHLTALGDYASDWMSGIGEKVGDFLQSLDGIDAGGVDLSLGLDGDVVGKFPGSELAERLYHHRDHVQNLYEAFDQDKDWQAGEIGLDLIGDLTENTEWSEGGEWIGNLGDFDAALESGDDWTVAAGALDLTEEVGEWAEWDSGTMKQLGTAGGIIGGLSTLTNLDDAFESKDFGALANAGSALATSFGADALASSLDNFVPYANFFTGFTSDEPLVGALNSIGSYIGQTLIPIPGVGAFVGSLVVGAIGDLFGSDPPPPPEAEATLAVDESGSLFVESATDQHGGNAGSMSVAAQRAADTINNLVEVTGGRLLDPSDMRAIEIGYDGDGVYAGSQRFDSVADAIGHIVESRLGDAAIEGGDVYAKRALYRQLEDGFDMAEMADALEAAQAHSHYQQRAAEIERLAEDEAVADELAAYKAGEVSRNDLGAAATLVIAAQEAAAAAESLGLDRTHRFDTASRLNDGFEQAGVDIDGVEVTDLVLANLHGELVVAIRDPENPEAAIRDLQHASVDAYVADFDAAMLYLPNGDSWNLQALVELVGAEPGGGAVAVEQALIDRYADQMDALRMGSAGDDVVVGTAADEALVGWQGSDVLRAGVGDDRLIGGAGHDELDGGAGQDTADYGASADGVAVDLAAGTGRGGDADGDTLRDVEHLRGSGHDDRLAGDVGANELSGDAGDDTLLGRAGSDALHGGWGDDRIDGGAGDDRLAGHAGDDVLAGGAGHDRVAGGAGDDQLVGDGGDDLLMAGSGDDRASGGLGDDTIHGGAGDDLLAGDAGTDTVLGGSGNDMLLGRGDGDILVGGEGRDTVAYEHDLADYRVELVGGDLRVGPASGEIGAGDRLIDVETIQFGDRSVSVETLREYLAILDEADEEERDRRISGMARSGSTAIGDAAAIGLVAGFAAPAIAAEQQRVQQAHAERTTVESDERLGPSLPPTVVDSDSLADLASDGIASNLQFPVTGGNGGGGAGGVPATSSAGSGGGAGPGIGIVPPGSSPESVPPQTAAAVDLLDEEGKTGESGSADEPATADVAADSQSDSSLEAIDQDAYYLVGTVGADELVDDRQLGRIYGLGGDDLVHALDGDDRVFGGAGDDIILPGTGRDEVDGGAGFDTVSYRDAAAAVGINLRAGIGTAGAAAGDRYAGIEAAEGSRFADSLIAPDLAATALYGLDGDDSLIGGTGSDTLIGGRGSDTYVGGGGDDLLVIDAGDDLGFVDGGAGNDTVTLAESLGRTVDLARLDGVETVIGSSGDDTWRASWDLARVAGGEGHDVTLLDENIREIVTFDPDTGVLEGIEWTAGGEALRLAPGSGETVTIETEEIHFDGLAIYLDGRDNAPITYGETFAGREDTALAIGDRELTANDFDIDPGDTVSLISVEGIDIGLTRALSEAYSTGSFIPEQLEAAEGAFRAGSYGSYRTPSSKEHPATIVDIGSRPSDRLDGTSGDDVIIGQVLTEYTPRWPSGANTETFHDSDRLYGHDGNDIFVTGGGGDLVVGGTGTDTVDYSRSGHFVKVDLLTNSGEHGRASGDELLGIENVIGSDDDDFLHGDQFDNVLQGGNGNDVLEGRGGDDILVGGGGRWDAAIFSGDRAEYEISVHGNHVEVEHLNDGIDGADKLYGIQQLRFQDENVSLGRARASMGEVRVNATGIEFEPDQDFNSLDGSMASFDYRVGNPGGNSAVATAEIALDAVNDSPYLAPGGVDYDGKLWWETISRQISSGGHPEDNRYESIGFWTVNAAGHILGRDVEDSDSLTYQLVDDTDRGWVTVDADGSFLYRLNVGQDGGYIGTEDVRVCEYTNNPHEPMICRMVEQSVIVPPEDFGISTGEARYESFKVAITDHGEGDSDPITVVKTVRIENDPPRDDDDCFPVAMDLGDDGLDFRGVDDSDLLADINDDGVVDQIAWIGAKDGLLMLDRDGDGAFSGADEISFVADHPDARTDMEGLALAFDSNADGLLDSADDRWSKFHVWQDADGNGISNPGELRTLDEAGITSIGVISDGRQEVAAGGDVTIFGRSAFTREDGSTGVAGDVALRYESLGEQPPSNDELAAMMVQRFAQARSLQDGEPSIDGIVPVDDTALMAAMSASDEFEMSSAAG